VYWLVNLKNEIKGKKKDDDDASSLELLSPIASDNH
jgi:hypothetical protein